MEFALGLATTATTFSWIDGAIIVIFFGFIVFAGTYFHKWIKNPEDYFVAGRQLTPFILAAALATLDIYENDDLFARAASLEAYWEDAVHRLDNAANVIDVRNIGIVAGIDSASI